MKSDQQKIVCIDSSLQIISTYVNIVIISSVLVNQYDLFIHNPQGWFTDATRTILMPAFWDTPLPPHDKPYYWFTTDPKSTHDKVKVTNFKILPKIQNFEILQDTLHTFWCCLIRCINMKWIQPDLGATERTQDAGRTDGQMDGWKEWNQYTPQPLPCAQGIIIWLS